MEKKCAHEHGKDESESAEEAGEDPCAVFLTGTRINDIAYGGCLPLLHKKCRGIKGRDTCGAWAMHDRLWVGQEECCPPVGDRFVT